MSNSSSMMSGSRMDWNCFGLPATKCSNVRQHLDSITHKSPKTMHRRIVTVIGSFACSLLLAGCSHTASAPHHVLPVIARSVAPEISPTNSKPAPAPDPAALAMVHVRELPLYKEAQQSCASRNYSHAADLLLKLSRTPNLSLEEIKFCLTQVDVCRKDAGVSPLPQSTNKLAVTADHRPPATNTQLADCGPRALASICEQLAVPTDLAALRKAAGTTKDGTTMEGLAAAAKSVGLKTEGVQTGRDALPHLQMPAIAWTGNHYIAVLALHGGPGDAGSARIHDPNDSNETTISQESLLRRSYGGYLLLVHR